MLHTAVARTAAQARDAGRYQRHRPEQTLLYRIVDEYYPVFTAHLAEQGREVPGYVQREFEDYLKCGRLEHGFLRVRCETCHTEHLVAFSCKRRGFCPSCGARRMAESAALLVDEVLPGQPMRQWVLSFPFPLRFLFASRPEIIGRVLGIVYRVIATHLVKKAGHTHQTAKTGAVTLIQRFGSALNLNIHFHMLFLDGVYVDQPDGAARFRWVKAPTSAELTQLAHTIAYRVGRFLERQGLLERDGTTHVIFEPLDFIARLAALVPKPRVNLTRFHGVFAPNSNHRALVTPAKRGKGNRSQVHNETEENTPVERHAAMTWAQRLKRVFNIDIETCVGCGGAVKVIACIEDPVVIKKILSHLEEKAETKEPTALPESRAPPPVCLQAGLFN